jgi:hypothetical protein
MNYAFEMASSGVINIPNFVNICPRVQKGHTHRDMQPYKHTHGQRVDIISILLFFFCFRNMKIRLKIMVVVDMYTGSTNPFVCPFVTSEKWRPRSVKIFSFVR